MENQEQQPQTLDDVYKQFNVQETAQQFNATPQTQQQQKPKAEVNIPDPALDVEGFRKYMSNITAHDDEVRQTLYSINERLTKQDQERIRSQEEADLKAAVSAVKEKLGEFDEDFIEVALAHRARKDEKFMNLWNNRQQKPEAFKAALNVVSNELAKKFAVKRDPQLAENQRAMKVSRDQMATTQKPNPNEKWEEAIKDGNFEHEWSKLVSGY